MKENGLLEIIAAHRTMTGLEEILKRDKYYQEALVEEQAASDIMDSLNLTSEQKKAVAVSLLHIISAVQLMEQQRTDLRWKMGSE